MDLSRHMNLPFEFEHQSALQWSALNLSKCLPVPYEVSNHQMFRYKNDGQMFEQRFVNDLRHQQNDEQLFEDHWR